MNRRSKKRIPAGGSSVPLLRAGQVVSTLTGAFGQALRETRITAILGYLVALNPSSFERLFGLRGDVRNVGVETRHEDGRSDVLVETSLGRWVIEAKLDASDPLQQTKRYGAKYSVLLCFRRTAPSQMRAGVRYVHWEDLALELRRRQGVGASMQKLVSRDLLQYLEDKNVVRKHEAVEIYAREINEETTLRLFLKATLYGCDYKAGSRLTEARYFAPHFGQRVSNEYPGVTTGISYVSKVEGMQTVSTWRELKEALIEERGKIWFNKHEEFVLPLHRQWKWPKSRTFLLLGEPRLVFNPPVRKENIQSGRGYLSKQFLSFDELFEAWKH